MKLLSITFKSTPRMPGVRASELSTIQTESPGDAMKGWRVSIRGQQVFFISPQGWVRDQNVKKRDPNGDITVFEIPRSDVYFEWQGKPEELEAMTKGGKFESPAFGPPPRKIDPSRPILDQAQMGDA